jgi:DNA-binding MarR family transcriptional regulator
LAFLRGLMRAIQLAASSGSGSGEGYPLAAIDEFAGRVEVPGVTGGLSDHVQQRPRAVSSGDMSRNGKTAPVPAGGWLDGDQQRAWLAYIRVQLRLAYEMNRQLLTDSGMSLPDYDVLTALNVADRGRMPITVLAAQIGWERSRVSHHVRRMSARGLVTCGLSAADRRVTEVTLTARGWQALEEAAPGHVDLVRRLFFEGLPEGLVGPLSEALESVYANIIKQGSLPPPVDWHPAEG